MKSQRGCVITCMLVACALLSCMSASSQERLSNEELYELAYDAYAGDFDMIASLMYFSALRDRAVAAIVNDPTLQSSIDTIITFCLQTLYDEQEELEYLRTLGPPKSSATLPMVPLTAPESFDSLSPTPQADSEPFDSSLPIPPVDPAARDDSESTTPMGTAAHESDSPTPTSCNLVVPPWEDGGLLAILELAEWPESESDGGRSWSVGGPWVDSYYCLQADGGLVASGPQPVDPIPTDFSLVMDVVFEVRSFSAYNLQVIVGTDENPVESFRTLTFELAVEETGGMHFSILEHHMDESGSNLDYTVIANRVTIPGDAEDIDWSEGCTITLKRVLDCAAFYLNRRLLCSVSCPSFDVEVLWIGLEGTAEIHITSAEFRSPQK